jgi:hypothetical protein
VDVASGSCSAAWVEPCVVGPWKSDGKEMDTVESSKAAAGGGGEDSTTSTKDALLPCASKAGFSSVYQTRRTVVVLLSNSRCTPRRLWIVILLVDQRPHTWLDECAYWSSRGIMYVRRRTNVLKEIPWLRFGWEHMV